MKNKFSRLSYKDFEEEFPEFFDILGDYEDEEEFRVVSKKKTKRLFIAS